MSRNGSSPTSARFGTLGGVFTPCVLTILGVIMFLRYGQVVGQAGVWQAILIVLVAKVITILTGLSLSAIATNTRTKGGGAYYLISRSLGVEFGGTIGIVFFLAQAISVAMYVIGFSEAFTATFPDLGWSLQSVGSVVNVVVFVCVFIGAGWTIRVQYAILGVLALSLISFFAGVFREFDVELLQSNMSPGFDSGWTFVTTFALFFPAVTGIMAGANMSGDLKDPARSIPRGTLAAIVVTAVVYLAMAVCLGAVRERDVLKADSLVMARVAVVPVLITAGVFAATLSSALGSMMGAPRILQAFARDRVLPGLRVFARGSGKGSEPRAATVLTFLVAQACIMLGGLDAIAPVITMSFMITYGTLNLATFYEGVTRNPSYRPLFRWCHWSLSLLGALGCGAVMVLLDPFAAFVSIVGLVAIHGMIRLRELEAGWGDLRSGVAFVRARRSLHVLEEELYHPKNWRPILLALSGAGTTRRHLAVYAHWITAGHGILSLGQVIQGEPSELIERRSNQRDLLRKFIRDENMTAFATVVATPTIKEGILALVQCHGLGGLEPNTVLLGWPENPERREVFSQVLRTVAGMRRSLMIARSRDGDEDLWSAPRGTIDVWWRGRDNGVLLLLVSHLLRRNPAWRNRRIRLLRVIPTESAREEVVEHLRSLSTESRITAEVVAVVSKDPAAAIRAESAGAAIALLGFQPPEAGATEAFFESLEQLSIGVPRVLFVWNAGGVSLEG